MSSVSNLREKQLHLLLKLYEATEAYRNSFASRDQLTQQLDLDESLIVRIIHRMIAEGLIVQRWYTTISLTHKGIKEMESVLENPESDTTYLPAYTFAKIRDDKRRAYKIFSDYKEMRLAFLNRVYELTKGNEEIVVESHVISQTLGFNNNMLDRVYFYLIDEGLILYRKTVPIHLCIGSCVSVLRKVSRNAIILTRFRPLKCLLLLNLENLHKTSIMSRL
jgi:Mn-dependent DtxR family transcriptional regulator